MFFLWPWDRTIFCRGKVEYMWKILTVDDNDIHRNMMTALLIKAGFEVTSAINGQEAISKSITDSPDVVLLDVNLPDISGYQVCKQIKGDVRTASLPVVFFTGEMNGAAKNHADLAGAAAFLTYPVQLSHLKTVIDSVVAKARGADVRYLSGAR